MDILETDAYDRRQRRNLSLSVLLSLLPFLLSTGVYFYLVTPEAPPTLLTAVIKASPTLLLAAVVLSWSRSVLGVSGGLLLSAVGDVCLVWPDLFLHGMAAFAAAHLFYSLTFLSARYASDSAPSCWPRILYLVLGVAAAGFYAYTYPFLQRAPDSAVLVPAVGVYVVLITVMGSLAVRTRNAATLLGSLSFLVSDITLATQVFKVTAPLQHGNAVVMATYYLAQMLIAVGDMTAANDQDEFNKWKKN